MLDIFTPLSITSDGSSHTHILLLFGAAIFALCRLSWINSRRNSIDLSTGRWERVLIFLNWVILLGLSVLTLLYLLNLAYFGWAWSDRWLALLIYSLSSLTRRMERMSSSSSTSFVISVRSVIGCILLGLSTLISSCDILIINTLDSNREDWIGSIFSGLFLLLLLLVLSTSIWDVLSAFIRLIWVTTGLVVACLVTRRRRGCSRYIEFRWLISLLASDWIHVVIPRRCFNWSG